VNAPRHSAGFTTIELLMVVGLIALVMGTLLTNLGGGFGVHLSNSGRGLAREIEYVGQRAVATGRAHRLLVDLDEQAFRVEVMAESERDASTELPEHAELLDLSPPLASQSFSPVRDRSGDWHWLDDGDVGIDEVVIGDNSVTDGEVGITFAPDGGADPAEIWLIDDGGYELRVRVVAFTGEIHVDESER